MLLITALIYTLFLSFANDNTLERDLQGDDF